MVPPEMSAIFDIRLAIDVDLSSFERMVKNVNFFRSNFHSNESFRAKQINEWCREAGDDIKLKFRLKFPKAPITATDPSNPYWVAFKQATDKL